MSRYPAGMEIVLQSKDRLSLVARPWPQSLSCLGAAVFLTLLSFEAYGMGASLAMHWLATGSALLCWGTFFLCAQRSEVTFDRETGQMRIARRTMFGRTGMIVPLSVITAIRAEHVAPVRHLPWQYRLTLSSGAEGFAATMPLVPGLFAEPEAARAARRISAWLDSGRAAA